MRKLVCLAVAAAILPVSAAAQPRPRALAAPPAAECARLQQQLQPALPRPLTRATAEVRYFSGELDVSGPGCVLTARGTLNQFDGDGRYWERLQARIRAAGFRFDPGMSADGGGGSVIGFRRADRYLSAMYEEDDGGLCDPAGPPASDCELPPERTRVTVQVGLAVARP